jgi:hypothetical protein
VTGKYRNPYSAPINQIIRQTGPCYDVILDKIDNEAGQSKPYLGFFPDYSARVLLTCTHFMMKD